MTEQVSRRLSGSLCKSDSLISNQWLPLRYHDRCCSLCCSTTACCHCRELLQTPSDVRRWQICQTPSFSLLCPQHRDALAGTTACPYKCRQYVTLLTLYCNLTVRVFAFSQTHIVSVPFRFRSVFFPVLPRSFFPFRFFCMTSRFARGISERFFWSRGWSTAATNSSG